MPGVPQIATRSGAATCYAIVNSLRDFPELREPDAAIIKGARPLQKRRAIRWTFAVLSPPCGDVCSQLPPVRPSSRCSRDHASFKLRADALVSAA